MGLLDHLKSLAGIEEWDFSDRRATLRIPCRIEAELRKGKDATQVEIVDIGLRGLRMLVHGKVRKGAVVELYKRSEANPGVTGKIEWKKPQGDGFLTGVSFQDGAEELGRSWLFEEVRAIGEEAVKTEQRRAGVRVFCATPALLKHGTEKRQVELVDLGLGGALIESDGGTLQTGEQVRLEFGPIEELPRVVVDCEVISTHKRGLPRYGLQIDSFFVGGVTDLEKYLSYFFARNKSSTSKAEDSNK